MVELTTRWDQSSIDPTTRKLAQEKAARLERDGRRVQEDSMWELLRRGNESEHTPKDTGGCPSAPPTKKPKNAAMKAVEKVLE